jgi:HK97 family phage prohead protease
MPYFITDKSADCSGWATIKEDGEVIGCHETKEDAIAQMVAVSIAENMEPGGERALPEELTEGDYVMWFNGDELMQGEIKEIQFDGELLVPNTSEVMLGTPFNPAALIQVYTKIGGAWKDTNNFVAVAFEKLRKTEDLEEVNQEAETDLIEEVIDEPSAEEMTQERATPNSLNIGNFVSWDTSGGRAQGRIIRIVRDGSINVPNSDFTITGTEDDPAALIRLYRPKGNGYEATTTLVSHKFSTLTKIDELPENTEEENNRAINQEAPAYMRAAARRGLQYVSDGFAGDGLTDKTIREAREMADGNVSDDKWVRIAAWIARHMPDLDAPQNSDPSDSQYPGAGLVAHLLWGSGPSKRAAQRTMEYAQGVVERIRREEEQARWASVNVQLKEKKEETMPSSVERRVNDVTFEIRQGEVDTKNMTFTGYAAVFNSPSEPLPFTEFIMPGAFKRSLKSRNEVKLFMNHNTDIVLGSTRAKTLKLSEDSKGLLAEAILPDTTAGRDLSVLMQRGDVSSMSFGFSVPSKGDKWSNDGATRELHQIRLHEVSIVTGFPAYEATTATVRSIDALATRTGMDADVLADALTKLEAGENLSTNHASVINEAVSKLKEANPTASELLAIKQKQLDLMLKAI